MIPLSMIIYCSTTNLTGEQATNVGRCRSCNCTGSTTNRALNPAEPRSANGRTRADHGAGDLRAAVARRLADIVVGVRVDHDRRAVRVEQLGERRMGQNDGLLDDAVGCDLDVRQVARMRPSRVVEPMLLAGGVPMGACARKVRRVAAADRVDVDAMDAVRQAVCLDMEADAAAGLPGAD